MAFALHNFQAANAMKKVMLVRSKFNKKFSAHFKNPPTQLRLDDDRGRHCIIF